MATGGVLTGTFQGVGETYTKSWDMQPVSQPTVADEIALLLSNADDLLGAYAAVTKGLFLSGRLGVTATTSPPGAEAGAYRNRAAVIKSTVDGVPEKAVSLWIQAARNTIFVGNSGDALVVDTADPALLNYMDALNRIALVSDGEIPSDVPISGYRIDRAFSGKD